MQKINKLYLIPFRADGMTGVFPLSSSVFRYYTISLLVQVLNRTKFRGIFGSKI